MAHRNSDEYHCKKLYENVIMLNSKGKITDQSKMFAKIYLNIYFCLEFYYKNIYTCPSGFLGIVLIAWSQWSLFPNEYLLQRAKFI